MSLNPQDITFIINPNSGKRSPQNLINKIRKYNPEFNIFISHTIEEFDRFMVENLDRFKYFIVAGGDGAINLTANYLFARPDKIMAVIPIGSGNGFARETKFYVSFRRLMESLERGKYYKVDVLEINGKKFINVAGFGFDANVAHIFAELPIRGLIGYAVSSFRSIREFTPRKVKIGIGNKNYEKNYKMVTFANTRQFGNNAYIAPAADPGSGKIDLVLVRPFPIYYYPVFVAKMFLGDIRNSKYVDYLSVDGDINIDTDYDKFHLDGEPIFINEPVKLKIHKASLNILDTAL